MTTGHRHRIVRLPDRLTRLLRTPLVTTRDHTRITASRWVWRREDVGHPAPDGRPEFPPVYVLTPLGILHTLTGLTLTTDQEPADDH